MLPVHPPLSFTFSRVLPPLPPSDETLDPGFDLDLERTTNFVTLLALSLSHDLLSSSEKFPELAKKRDKEGPNEKVDNSNGRKKKTKKDQ